MATMMNAMNGSLNSARFDSKSSFSQPFTKFLQQRAALPEMPERDSHMSVVAGVALRLAAAAVPVTALTWLAVAG